MSTVCGRITAGFNLNCVNPIVGGIDDLLILGNLDEFTITYDPANPLLVVNVQPISTAKLYAFYGTNNSFGSMSKQVLTTGGPRYEHTNDFNIMGNDTDIKEQLIGLGFGRVISFVFNNWKEGDSAIEMFGATHGLQLKESERNTADDAMEGGYKLKLGTPDRLKEPQSPAGVLIPVTTGTYTTTKEALFALLGANIS